MGIFNIFKPRKNTNLYGGRIHTSVLKSDIVYNDYPTYDKAFAKESTAKEKVLKIINKKSKPKLYEPRESSIQRKQFVGSPLMQSFPNTNAGDSIFSSFERQTQRYQQTRHKPRRVKEGYYLDAKDFDMIDY